MKLTGSIHQLVETLLLLDEVSGFVDARHEFVESARPIVEHLRLALLLGEVNDAGWTVDLHFECAVVDQLGEELFSLQLVEIEQLGHAGSGDACVVVGDDSNVLSKHLKINFKVFIFCVQLTCSIKRLLSSSQLFLP